MTEVEKKAFKEYPDNEALREAYIKGANEFCIHIWAKIKVDETKECAGHYLDENVSMATYSDKLDEISTFAYDLCHETTEDDD